jgi:hypothetical protein
MTYEEDDEAILDQVKSLRDEMLLDTALKALLYGGITYVYSYFFSQHVWQWYAFGLFMLFNIAGVLYAYYWTMRLGKNQSIEHD